MKPLLIQFKMFQKFELEPTCSLIICCLIVGIQFDVLFIKWNALIGCDT